MVYTHACAACAHMGPEEGVECPALSCHHFLKAGPLNESGPSLVASKPNNPPVLVPHTSQSWVGK